jgi:nitrogen fixation NifU-like protein
MPECEGKKAAAELYREALLALYRQPLGSGPLPAGREWAEASNRTCGDRVRFAVEKDGDTILRCWQETAGCAVTTATASLLVRALPGRSVEAARSFFRDIERPLASGGGEASGTFPPEVEELEAVRHLPSRRECVRTAVRAAERALAEAAP